MATAPAPPVTDLDGLSERCRWPVPPGGTATAAVSGGPDSLALLVLARRAGLDVLAVHVDHGLRPGSAAEADHVAAAARRLGARFEARRASVTPGPNLESRARAARYAVLPPGVMVGHTADDRAETLLLNLLRGAGLDGLSPMRPSPRLSRPLLALRRRETAAVCAAAGLEPLHDPSNDDLALRRNAVRHRLLPLLAEVAGRDPVPILCRQADLLGDDADLLEGWAADLDPTDARALRAAPRALARRAVRRWLRHGPGADAERHPPSAAEVERVLAVAGADAAACELAGGRRVRRRSGRLWLEPGE
ncbi:MAG TPA: tRNA lysidine(34) synthetase TilS [Acidimicrobiales bacterium]|nr:tRNA lysidine(34) synthetase TilS [Acidimicrobiales bacterium]